MLTALTSTIRVLAEAEQGVGPDGGYAGDILFVIIFLLLALGALIWWLRRQI